MFIFFFIFISIFCAILLEFSFATYGLFIPILPILFFYVTGLFGLKRTLFIALLTGFALDIVYDKVLLVTSFELLFIVFFSELWHTRIDTKSSLLYILSGGITGLFYSFITIFFELLANGISLLSIYDTIIQLLFIISITSLIMPLQIFILDCIAEYFGFEHLILERNNKAKEFRVTAR